MATPDVTLKVTKNTLRARAARVAKLVGYDIAVVDTRSGYAVEVDVATSVAGALSGGQEYVRIISRSTAREVDAFLRGMQVVATGNDQR